VLDADARLLAARDARAQADTEAARAAVRSFRASWAAAGAKCSNFNRIDFPLLR
jgi:hypothetical protein